MMKYRILHIPTNTFIKRKQVGGYMASYPTVEFWWKWKAERWLKKLPDEFYFLDKNDKYEKTLKAELIVVPVHDNRYVGK